MLNEKEVAEIAEKVLRGTLAEHGFDHAEVRFGDDYDGAASIFVEAFFAEGADATPGAATINAISGVAHALEQRGETRFPYFSQHFAGDEIGEE